jgi:hypothetical protein
VVVVDDLGARRGDREIPRVPAYGIDTPGGGCPAKNNAGCTFGNIWIARLLLQFSMEEMRKRKHEVVRVLALMTWLTACATAEGEQVQHLTITQPDGMPGWPILTGIQYSNYVASLSWDGPSGYYQLYQTTNLTNPNWQKFGSPTRRLHRRGHGDRTRQPPHPDPRRSPVRSRRGSLCASG